MADTLRSSPARFFVFLIGTLALSACSARDSNLVLLLEGPQKSFDSQSATTFADERDKIVPQIVKAAGLNTKGPTTSDEWRQFVITAFDYADGQCEDYITAIRRLHIARRQVSQELNLIGTATAGVLGLARAASSAISATAIAFGFTQATVENVVSGFLYELPPYAVRDLVTRLRLEYSSGLTNAHWTDRSTAFRTIRGYIQLCLPAVIEAHAATAIATAATGTIKPTTGSNPTGTPPAVTVNKVATAGPGAAQSQVVVIRDPVPPRLDPGVQVRKNAVLRRARSIANQAAEGDADQLARLHRIATILGVPIVNNAGDLRSRVTAAIEQRVNSPDPERAREQMTALETDLREFGPF